VIARSALFHVLFFLNLLAYMIVALPTFLLPHRVLMELAKSWARTSIWLLRIVCGIWAEFAGLHKIPRGACVVAAKHQSTFETFALLPLFADPTFILKRELMWIPIFGWYTWKGGMIPVDRAARARALSAMTECVRRAFAQGRQIIIFPEGTRRPPGAEPRYKVGVLHLYAETGAVCVPIALNSGLFWPRRRLSKSRGTIRIEILDPIQPGLDKEAFMARLQSAIEAATARLVAEGRRELGFRFDA
jgi:1-acyl-sn-glycerol-3-phosphate acyltransferase